MNTNEMSIDDQEHSISQRRLGLASSIAGKKSRTVETSAEPYALRIVPLRAQSRPEPHPGNGGNDAAGNESLRFFRADGHREMTLRIEGPLNANTAPEIRSALDALIAARPRRVKVDVSGLHLIDSSGLGAIVSLFNRVRTYGGDLRLVGMQGQPLAIFKLLRLDRIFAL